MGTKPKAPRGALAATGEKPIRFRAVLLRPASIAGPSDWRFIRLSTEASTSLPSRGYVTVEGTINGTAFLATLNPDGEGGHWLKVSTELIRKARLNPGAEVALEITPAKEEPEPEVPADIRTALEASPAKARTTWADITPAARRDWVQWMVSGKRAETRTSRIVKACDMLASGKRRPCCFDRSGMYDKSLSCPAAAKDDGSQSDLS